MSVTIPRSFSDKFQLRSRFVVPVIRRSKIVAYDVRSLSDHGKVSNVLCATDGNTGYAILEFHERITGELSDLAMGSTCLNMSAGFLLPNAESSRVDGNPLGECFRFFEELVLVTSFLIFFYLKIDYV